MFAYLEKFKRLPAEIKAKISGPEAVQALELLEKEYNLPLAAELMKLAVKELPLGELPRHLQGLGLDEPKAVALSEAIKVKLLKDILPYFGEKPAPDALSSVLEEGQALDSEPVSAPVAETQPEPESLLDVIEEASEILSTPEITAPEELLEISAPEKNLEIAAPVVASIETEEEEKVMIPVIIGAQEAPKPLDIKIVEEEEKDPLPPTDPAKEENIENIGDVFLSAADQLPVTPGLPDIYTLQVDACIEATLEEAKEIGIKIDDADFVARLESLLRSFLRGVRSKIDTRIALNKPVEKSGLGLDDEDVSHLFRILEEQKKRIIREGQPLPVKAPVQPALEKLRKLDAQAIDSVYDLAARLDVRHELPAPAPDAPRIYIPENVNDKPSVNRLSAETELPTKEIKAETPLEAEAPVRKPAHRPFFGMFGKIKMQDIKTVKILNPVDELRYLDLVNFRRMGADARAISKKLLDKIKLLEKDGYDKFISGVGAWRQSPINKLYLSMAGESAEAGRPLKEVVEIRKQSGQEYLSLEEIEAIIDMNKELNY
jgi:hypothetical protein